jgi:hypothetical protein
MGRFSQNIELGFSNILHETSGMYGNFLKKNPPNAHGSTLRSDEILVAKNILLTVSESAGMVKKIENIIFSH